MRILTVKSKEQHCKEKDVEIVKTINMVIAQKANMLHIWIIMKKIRITNIPHPWFHWSRIDKRENKSN